jgi:hypothetical protein
MLEARFGGINSCNMISYSVTLIVQDVKDVHHILE